MKVLLTGGRGMLGQALKRSAAAKKTDWDILSPTSDELDLCDESQVKDYFSKNQFDLVIHAAAKVGGIKANIKQPVEFLVENLKMGVHLLEQARLSGVKKLINIGSSCMYPKDYHELLKEEHILAAPLEPTNEGYALSKISVAKLCESINKQYGCSYKTLIPCNLYGPGDHFDPEKSHLVAAAILKIHKAKAANQPNIEIWGDGTARREFMYVDDLADMMIDACENIEKLPDFLNIGAGKDHSVNDYYTRVKEIIGYDGEFTHNLDAPVGMMKKLMDSSLANSLQLNSKIPLEQGLKETYKYYLKLIGENKL